MAAHQVSPRSVKKTDGIWTEGRAEIGETHGLLTQRVQHTTDDIVRMKKVGEITIKQFELQKYDKGEDKFPNQEESAITILKEFMVNLMKTMIFCLGLTQSGKTGVMAELIKEAVTCERPIPIENIFIITALSDLEWKYQTKSRFPPELQNNIYHRHNLTKEFKGKVYGKKNVLILIDEVHVACKNDQTLEKALEECGFLDLQVLLRDDIKIVEFTATPNGTLYDLDGWGSHAGRNILQPGKGYTSPFDLLKKKRVFQSFPLVAEHKFEVEPAYEEILKHIQKFDSTIWKKKKIRGMMNVRGRGPLWHIIRTPAGDDNQSKVRDLLEEIMKENGKDVDFQYYDQGTGPVDEKGRLTNDLNDWLKDPPPTGKHTFILIKEKLRCSKTFIKKHIGIVYERQPDTPNDDVVTQGLLGRMCGYDDNGFSVVFTNVASVYKYEKWWKSGFTEEVSWKSGTTKFTKGEETTSTGTVNGTLKNGGVVVAPIIAPPPWTFPDTHEIDSGFEEYDESIHGDVKTFWNKRCGKGQTYPLGPGPKGKNEEDGWAYCVDHQLGGGSKKVKTKKQIQDKVKKLDAGTWKLQSMGWKKDELWNRSKNLPNRGTPVKRAYICYNNIDDEDQKQKPVIYWRELRHKQSINI